MSKELGLNTKLRIFKSNVKTVLLYGSETWRLTASASRKLQSFINGCLRRIVGIRWYDRVTNAQLWEGTSQRPVKEDIQVKKWKWIGHTLRRPPTSIIRQALTWNPQGKRKKGRPKMTWRRAVQAEMEKAGTSWKQLEKDAQDRLRWRNVVDGLCSTGS